VVHYSAIKIIQRKVKRLLTFACEINNIIGIYPNALHKRSKVYKTLRGRQCVIRLYALVVYFESTIRRRLIYNNDNNNIYTLIMNIAQFYFNDYFNIILSI